MHRIDHRAISHMAVVALGIAFAGRLTVQAHKAVTSQYTYNEDVFPILRDYCGACHVEGGAAPMSLLNYKNASGGAFAWAQSIRDMLVSEAMPPWYADATGPPVEHMHTLSSRDLDIVVTWANGGTPEGDPARRPVPIAAHVQWSLGKPDVTVVMPTEHHLDAKTARETFDVTIATNLTSPMWIRAADLLPGTPSMVRRALISVQNGPVLRVWEPGDEVPVAPEGTAFQLPAGAKLHLQIFYKKSWQNEQEDKSDRSTIGLYFARAVRAGIDTVTLNGPMTTGDAPVSFSGKVDKSVRAIAVRPQLDRPYASMGVAAVTASGARLPLLKLHAARPEWPRRYWLRRPVDLPAGTRLEVTGTPSDPEEGPLGTDGNWPLQVAVDFVPQ